MRGRVIRNHFNNQRSQVDANSGYGCQEIQVKSLGKIYAQGLFVLNCKIYKNLRKGTLFAVN